MIIRPDEKSLQAGEEPPPAYVDSEKKPVSDTKTPESDPLAATLTARSQPCNFVSIIRDNSSVKGPFVVDPSIYIPHAHLPPLLKDESEEDRKNLRLRSHNGSVDAEILLVDDGSEEGSSSGSVKRASRITVDLHSDNGSVRAKVSAPDRRRPIHITASSRNGSVTLYLPRSFRGFLTLTTHNGSIVFSEQLSPYVTTFSDISGTQRCFAGDLSSWVNRDEEWEGDQLNAGSQNGKVKLLYIDEADTEKDKRGGFWNRVFGV